MRMLKILKGDIVVDMGDFLRKWNVRETAAERIADIPAEKAQKKEEMQVYDET